MQLSIWVNNFKKAKSMRVTKYLSPTSIALWNKSIEEFYQQYLFDIRLPRMAQTRPMSIGSSFDAYVKSELHYLINGHNGKDDKFKLEVLFEKQVEPHNRDWAFTEGKYVLDAYKSLGAFDDLLVQIKHDKAEVRFETDLQGPIGDAVLMGKPDCYYFNRDNHPIILDWKVNSYLSKSPKSPEKGYLKLRGDPKKSRYPKAVPGDHKGTEVNIAMYFEEANQEWACQLSIYAWLCGAPIGGDFIVAIDQLVCNGSDGESRPTSIKVAEHRALVGPQFQKDFYAQVQKIWKQIQSGHIFADLSLSDSQERCRQLDEQLLQLVPGAAPKTVSNSFRQDF